MLPKVLLVITKERRSQKVSGYKFNPDTNPTKCFSGNFWSIFIGKIAVELFIRVAGSHKIFNQQFSEYFHRENPNCLQESLECSHALRKCIRNVSLVVFIKFLILLMNMENQAKKECVKFLPISICIYYMFKETPVFVVITCNSIDVMATYCCL